MCNILCAYQNNTFSLILNQSENIKCNYRTKFVEVKEGIYILVKLQNRYLKMLTKEIKVFDEKKDLSRDKQLFETYV